MRAIMSKSHIYQIVRAAALAFSVIACVLAPAIMSYAGVNEWVTNGPSGTIVYSLGVAPNYSTSKTVFAGTDSGAYRTTNAGASWTQSGLTGNHIFSLAVSPLFASDTTLFAGTNGAGVYKSTNAGTSWTQSGLTGASVSSLSISPNYLVDGTVFAGTSGGVYKSADGGANWTQVNTGLTHTYISAIAVSPNFASDATLFVGTSDGGGVYKSTNAGTSWTQVNTGLANTYISALSVSPNFASDATLFVGTSDGGGVYKSTNAGTSWTQSGLAGINIFSLSISPNYAADGTLVVGTYGAGVYISTNDAASWTQINSGLTKNDIPAVRFSPQYVSDYTLFGGTWSGGVFSCTTADSLPPVVNTIDPADAATSVARDKTVTVTFNENIQSGIAYNLITLKDSANNQVTVTKTISGRTLTLDPTSDLAYGTTYTVIIPAGAVKDTANNAFAAQYTSSFSTLAAPDTTAPTVGSTDPAAGATGVLRDKTVAITFSETIQSGAAYGSITFKTAAGTAIEFTKNINGSTLSLDPAGDLANNTGYTVTIPASAVKDAANNALAAQYTLSFTTQNDTTAPTVGSTDPAGNAIDVAKEKTITLTFSENIQSGTAYETIAVKDTSSTAVALTKSVKDKVLTLDPNQDLALGTKYTVTIPASAVKDSAGNALAAQYSFSFTTQSDTSTPGAPLGLKIVSNKGLAHISWTAPSSGGIAGYNVYRRLKADSTPTKLNTAMLASAEYKDTSVAAGTTYVYAVTALDGNAKESAKSSELEVAVEQVNESGFTDVPDSAWYKDYVVQLAAGKIISGYADGNFRPNNNVSRAEFAKMMCATMGWTLENPGTASFNDVSKEHWAYQYIETAKAKGIIGGYADGSFKPNKSIARAEIAKIVAETLSLPAGTSTLTDIAHSWAKEYIDKCVKANIVGGYNDNTFRPGNTASRAEAAKMVVGVLSAKP